MQLTAPRRYTRWSHEETMLVWGTLRELMVTQPNRDIFALLDLAQQKVLPPERWKKMVTLKNVHPLLLARLMEVRPAAAKEVTKPIAGDRSAFITLLSEQRLTRPADDFVAIYNECVQLVPDLKMPEVTHPKYIDSAIVESVADYCRALMDHEDEDPDLGIYSSSELILAWNNAIKRELNPPTISMPTEKPEGNAPSAISSSNGAGHTSNSPSLFDHEDERPSLLPPSHDPGRTKVKVIIVDHNVARDSVPFIKRYENHPRWKFRFDFWALDSTKGAPTFHQGSWVVLSERAPANWKRIALENCGFKHVKFANGGMDSTYLAMQQIVAELDSQPK